MLFFGCLSSVGRREHSYFSLGIYQPLLYDLPKHPNFWWRVWLNVWLNPIIPCNWIRMLASIVFNQQTISMADQIKNTPLPIWLNNFRPKHQLCWAGWLCDSTSDQEISRGREMETGKRRQSHRWIMTARASPKPPRWQACPWILSTS